MGNVESAPGEANPAADPGGNNVYWHHSTNPPKQDGAGAGHAAPPPLALQRKQSSFLEEPVTHKLTERGEATVSVTPRSAEASSGREGAEDDIDVFQDAEDDKLRYAVSEMQGWRSHMEDKHALNPALSVNRHQRELLKDHHLFAVFDGHGGDFASHFCGEHLVSTLVSQRDWQAYLRLVANAREGTKSGPSQRDSVAGISLLKSALASTFLVLDEKLMQAQRARRVAQLSQLESLVFSLGGVVEHGVFQKGSKDRERVLNFDRQLPASMPANVPLERSGSTGVVVLVTPSHILCANAGDSRAVLSKRSGPRGQRLGDSVRQLSKDGVLPLSFDHKPANDVEVTRVEQDGGFVRSGRVDGDLAVSRSFGDFGYKNCAGVGEVESRNDRSWRAGGASPSQRSAPAPSWISGGRPEDHRVTVCPDILVHNREPARDEFVVLACDGIWDRLTNRDCADLVRSLVREEGETDVGLICEEVIDTALELDSRDNMTMCVVMFPGAGSGEGGPGRLETGDGGGVMKRRNSRAKEWGRDSTPAKRAHARLEERKRKTKEILAMQKAKVNKAQTQVQARRTAAPAPKASMSSGGSVCSARSSYKVSSPIRNGAGKVRSVKRIPAGVVQ
ncbi:hypothetical protein ACHAWF_003498 [Thalassiosira exigua]